MLIMRFPPPPSNWLRDYSQAVDVAGLKALPLQTIINLCMALGFLASLTN